MKELVNGVYENNVFLNNDEEDVITVENTEMYVVINNEIERRELDVAIYNVLTKFKNNQQRKLIRPVVETSLGFPVDGGYRDLTNFITGKKRGESIIRDANNKNHTATQEMYDVIIEAIEGNGITQIKSAWDVSDNIINMKSFEELELFYNNNF